MCVHRDMCLRAAAVIPSMFVLALPGLVAAATTTVPAGGDLQAALNAAAPGDTILLEPGATYVGNFVLPVHGGCTPITLRSATSDALLPPPGTRISPDHSPRLARLKSPNASPALATARGAALWTVMLLQFEPNTGSAGDIIALGDGTSAQSSLDLVPHDLVIDRVYVRGDPQNGQKRGIALNSGATTIINSYIADMKSIVQDAQAIAGWNGPGPYWIQNNYLEASGDNVLFGGDDPKISGLVPSDIVFRGNTLSRPVSWRDPIVATPANVTATAAAGALAAGTYAYRVVARRSVAGAVAVSAATAEITVTVDEGGGVELMWSPVPDATSYRVYGRTPGGLNQFWTVTSPSFIDSGAIGTAGTVPVATVWRVKNVFELKNARNVRVDFNIIENNWRQSQAGVAVLFTTRNQNGGCGWCVVENVTFEYNIVRHVGAALNVLGIDNVHPSQQANNIFIRNNLFYDVSRTWGGNAYMLLITNNPRNVTLEHNTYISPDGLGVVYAEGPPISGFVFTANIARHNTYGIIGTGTSVGLPSITRYFPDGIICDNVLAGGNFRLYPPCNEFPTITDFQSAFVDYANNDYEIKPEHFWRARGLGGDIVTLTRGVAMPAPLAVRTATLANTTVGTAYTATLTADGGAPPYTWTLFSGTLPPGIALSAATGALSGVPTAAGQYSFCARVSDDLNATATRPLTITVFGGGGVTITTTSMADARAGRRYVKTLHATGGTTPYTWSVVAGALPPGLALATTTGQVSGTPTAAGTYTFTVQVADATGLLDTQALSIVVVARGRR